MILAYPSMVEVRAPSVGVICSISISPVSPPSHQRNTNTSNNCNFRLCILVTPRLTYEGLEDVKMPRGQESFFHAWYDNYGIQSAIVVSLCQEKMDLRPLTRIGQTTESQNAKLSIAFKVIEVHNITLTYLKMHLWSNEGCPFRQFDTEKILVLKY